MDYSAMQISMKQHLARGGTYVADTFQHVGGASEVAANVYESLRK